TSSVNHIDARLTIAGEAGDGDSLRVYDAGDTAKESGRMRADELTGMGMALGIRYTGFEVLKVWLSDGDNAFFVESTHAGITYLDQSRGDPGINRLRIYGTTQADFFLLRANKAIGQGMVAAIQVDANRVPVPGGVIERINYDADISGAVEIFGRDGDDTFVLDDNLAPTT